MNNIDVIVFNSHGVGQYAYTDRLPLWGETVAVKNWHVAEDGGKGSNVAVALGRLGIKTAFVCKVGNDPWGDLGEKWLKEAGVNTKFLYRTDEVSTGTGLILINSKGQNLIIDGDSSSRALLWKEVEEALNQLNTSKFLITGYEVPYDLAMKSLKYAKMLNINTVLNPSPLPAHEIDSFEFVDYLFINEHEGEELLKIKNYKFASEEDILKKLKQVYKCKNIIMTKGSEGVWALIDNEIIRDEAVCISESKIKNTAGAGDGYMAAFVSELVKENSIKKALKFAKYYAALSITIEGTIPAYRPKNEVDEFIKNINVNNH